MDGRRPARGAAANGRRSGESRVVGHPAAPGPAGRPTRPSRASGHLGIHRPDALPDDGRRRRQRRARDRRAVARRPDVFGERPAVRTRAKPPVARAGALLRQSQDRFYAEAVDVRSQVRLARTQLLNARARVVFYHEEVLPTPTATSGSDTASLQRYVRRRVRSVAGPSAMKLTPAGKYIAALKDYWTARAELERAVGGSLPATPPQPSQP